MCHNDHKRLDLPTGRGREEGEGRKGRGERGGVLTRFFERFVTPSSFSIYKIHRHPRFKSGSVTIIDDRATTIRRRFTFQGNQIICFVLSNFSEWIRIHGAIMDKRMPGRNSNYAFHSTSARVIHKPCSTNVERVRNTGRSMTRYLLGKVEKATTFRLSVRWE